MIFANILILLLVITVIYVFINALINKHFLNQSLHEIQDINYIYINGVRINYVKKGEGKPLLLVHGFINSILMFDKMVDILSKHYTVLALDLIGFGFSDKHLNLTYTRKNMAEIAVKFMLSQGFDKFILMGHSMGGEVALNMAYYHPQSITKLILVDATGCTDILKLPNFMRNANSFWLFLLKICFKNYYFLKFCFKLGFYDKRNFDENLFNRIYSTIIRIPTKTLYKFGIQGDRMLIRDKISLISTDTLIIWGKNDIIVSLKQGQLLNRKLKNSNLAVIDNCGHIPFVEKSECFIDIIKGYLR